jgi:hypothetical protein
MGKLQGKIGQDAPTLRREQDGLIRTMCSHNNPPELDGRFGARCGCETPWARASFSTETQTLASDALPSRALEILFFLIKLSNPFGARRS